MKIDTLLQDVNIVIDWHDNGDFLDCYQEGDNSKVKRVLMLWRGSLYYAAARQYIHKHFEIARRAVKENKLYRRELPDKPRTLDDYDFGDDNEWFINSDTSWTECSDGADALAEAQKMIASGDDIDIVEGWRVTRTWELPELIDQYGEKEPA